MSSLRVLIVEDDALLRSSLAAALPVQGVDVVGATDSASGALELARRTAPDAAILDLHLGVGPSGIDIARMLRAQMPDLGLVILTSYSDPRLAGASNAQLPPGAEYLVKQGLPDVALLGVILHRCVAWRDGAPAPVRAAASPVTLSHVQVEVLRLVARGMSNADIAQARSVSEKAVEHTITRLCRLLDIDVSATGNARVLLARHYYELTGSARQ